MQRILTNSEQLGAALENRRHKLDLTQKDVRDQLGLSASAISRLENGSPNSRLGTLFSLLHILNLEIIIQEKADNRTDADMGIW